MQNEIRKICEEVAEQMCDKYCKWPEKYTKDNFEKMLEEKCESCPLNRIN